MILTKRLEGAHSNDLQHGRFENDLHRILFNIIMLASDPIQLEYYLNISLVQLDHVLASLWILEHDHVVRQEVAELLGIECSLPEDDEEAERFDLDVRSRYCECTDIEAVRRYVTVLAQSCLGSGKRDIAVLAKMLFATSPDVRFEEHSEADPGPAWRLRIARCMTRRAGGEQQVGGYGGGEQTEGEQGEGEKTEGENAEDTVAAWLV